MDVAQTNWPSIAGWKSTPKGAIIHATNQIFIRFNSSYLKASSMAIEKKRGYLCFFIASASRLKTDQAVSSPGYTKTSWSDLKRRTGMLV